MKIACTIFLFFYFHFSSTAQNIQVTKKLVDFIGSDVPIVAGSFHDTLHIVKKNAKGVPEIYLYNSSMDFLGTKQLALSNTAEVYTIQIIPFHNYYYAFLINRNEEKSKVMLVHASGKVEERTSDLKDALPLVFPGYMNVSKFYKLQNNISVAVTFYDSAKQKIYLGFYHLDSLLQKKDEHMTMLDYDPQENWIHTIFFPDTSHVAVIKSFNQYNSRAGQIEIFSYDFQTTKASKLTLSHPSFFFFNPILKYNNADSTFLLAAGVRQINRMKETSNQYYYMSLDRELRETALPRLIPSDIKDNEKTILVINKAHTIILQSGGVLKQRSTTSNPRYNDYIQYQPSQNLDDPFNNDRLRNNYRYPRRDYYYTSNQPVINMRIISLDQASQKNTNTLIKSKKGKFKSDYNQTFVLQRSGSTDIFYVTNLSTKNKGVSYISFTNGTLSEEEFLPVDHRYNYLIAIAQKINDRSFILPFTYNDKLGFLKVSF